MRLNGGTLMGLDLTTRLDVNALLEKIRAARALETAARAGIDALHRRSFPLRSGAYPFGFDEASFEAEIVLPPLVAPSVLQRRGNLNHEHNGFRCGQVWTTAS